MKDIWAINNMLKFRELIIKECQEELLKHLFPMTHKNGYPSEAVPKATILELDKLMKL